MTWYSLFTMVKNTDNKAFLQQKTTDSIGGSFVFYIIHTVIVAATYFPLFCKVSSAQRCLTSEFGMGSGVTLSLKAPGHYTQSNNNHDQIGYEKYTHVKAPLGAPVMRSTD